MALGEAELDFDLRKENGCPLFDGNFDPKDFSIKQGVAGYKQLFKMKL